MNSPVKGMRVLVTRAMEQSGGLIDALRTAGAEPVLMPLICFAPPADWSAVDDALRHLERYDALLFTSQNGVRFLLERARALGIEVVECVKRAFCVGPATARYAASEGFAVEKLPERSFDAEGMLAQFLADGGASGRHFLMPRAERGRDSLPDGLRRAGASVDVVITYRTQPAPVDGEELCRLLEFGKLDALTFTSPSTVAAFCALLTESAFRAAEKAWIVAIGSVTEMALRERDLIPDVVASTPEPQSLVEELAQAVKKRGASERRTSTDVREIEK